ncbi:PI31 proteasome regulator N-terminal-domain-containing protein [Sphaerosporella brunnea]|uniref:PI31 proteasome regulator N-terminal-domain-containing protein n=1 Tax=Sphaerosporella brunnea TaxID=1250544 RepID=A0A5J5EPG3_9PEZI|nr:PI31 proteasome regulator N-terminal-domain-containing protein [Sphaerosporella brunnea]
MSEIPLSPPNVLRLVNASLPKGENDQPQLKHPQDALAAFVHACMLSAGFRLIGLSEDDRIGISPSPLPENWSSTNGSYGFRYSHPQSSMQYLIKVQRLGGKTVIMGLGLGDDKTASFEIDTKDFTSANFFPYSGDVEGQKKLEDAFISESRMKDLASLIKINILQKLIPGLHKPGYEEERGGEIQQREQPRQQPRPDAGHEPEPMVPRPYGGPYGNFPRGPPPIPAGGEPMPGFDDEYEILQGPRGGYPYPPGGRNPLSIGADDLNPPGLGPNPPLRGPFFGEGGGMSGNGGMGPMGGMHPTPEHPMFGGRGNGRIPDPRAPPGARYDPVGPGDEPMGGLRGPRGPGGPGGFGGPTGFSGGAPHNPFSQFGSGDFM